MQPLRQVVTETVIEQSPLEPLIAIRSQVLRPNQPLSNCYYPEDVFKHTKHFAAFIESKTVGAASIYKEQHPDFALKQSWRVRGMAVLPEFQGKGIGMQLLQTCINHAIDEKADVIWCNARTNAAKFYKKAGFKVVGKEFEIESIGAHYLMAKNLGIHHSESKFIKIAKQIFANHDEEPIPVPQSRNSI
jgi:ribosomal protein S18 acetylase RimI-like enzyme